MPEWQKMNVDEQPTSEEIEAQRNGASGDAEIIDINMWEQQRTSRNQRQKLQTHQTMIDYDPE